MSVPPDPVELSAPRDPGSYGRARIMGPAFWAMIIFGFVCIAAGYALAGFGPKLLPVEARQPVETLGLSAAPAPAPAVPITAPASPLPIADGSAPSAEGGASCPAA